MHLDETNRRMLEVLRAEARTPISDLSRAVGRSETTVRKRLALLESRGVIRAYQTVIDASRIGYNARAWLAATCPERNVNALRERLAAVPFVANAVWTLGPKPLQLEVYAHDLMHLEEIIERRLLPLGLKDIEGRIILDTLIEDRSPPLRGGHASPAAAAGRLVSLADQAGSERRGWVMQP